MAALSGLRSHEKPEQDAVMPRAAAGWVRVVTIAPGLFHTPMLDGLAPEARESLGRQPLFPQRLGRPAEFAAMVLAVAANPLLNGTTLRLDGALRLPPG